MCSCCRSLLPSYACGGSKANVRKEETSATPKAVEVTTAAAITRELPSFFEATGSLAGDQQTDVAPQTSGKVVAVGVDIGSYVRRGQMIVRLDDSELKLRVAQAQAQVEQAKAAVRQAEEKDWTAIRVRLSIRTELRKLQLRKVTSGSRRKESASRREANRVGRCLAFLLRPAEGATRSAERAVRSGDRPGATELRGVRRCANKRCEC